MNISGLLDEIGEVVGCEIEQDIYTGNAERYATYTYEDERTDLIADNQTKADTAYIQVSYFFPLDYQYMEDKHKIRDYLESNGFKVTSIRCWVEDATTGYQHIRHLLFETNYTETRRKK